MSTSRCAGKSSLFSECIGKVQLKLRSILDGIQQHKTLAAPLLLFTQWSFIKPICCRFFSVLFLNTKFRECLAKDCIFVGSSDAAYRESTKISPIFAYISISFLRNFSEILTAKADERAKKASERLNIISYKILISTEILRLFL